MPELSRFLREKGGWELQSTVVRKGSEELPFLSTLHTIPYFSKVTKCLSPLVNLKTVFSAKRHIETT